jgi:BirA family biotin operon repressor/biotin-[acetyl-CoA-carboxylase] ligase
MPNTLSVEKIQDGLKSKLFGKYVFFAREVGSTNDWAKELAELGAPEGTVAMAETQTAGRGRLGRKWHSPRGGIWFSIILRPNIKPSEAVCLVFLASLAVAETLRELYGLKVETMWPNDVLVNGCKVCGTLSEMKTVGEKVEYVVIGVGLNANIDVKKELPPELWETATSLEEELGRKIALETLFKALLEKMEKLYQTFLEKGFAKVLAKWKTYAAFLGREVEVHGVGGRIEGQAIDVDDEGALVLRLKHGELKRVLAGDVSIKIGKR